MQLKKWLKQNGVSQSRFARMVDVSPSLISLICKGAHKPSIALCYRIEHATNGDVSRYDLRADAEYIWGPKSKIASSEEPIKSEIPYQEIFQYFNSVSGSKYRGNNKAYRQSILARWREGHTLEDFKRVIDNMYNAWHGTEFEKYLTPDTLFRASKFEKYLNHKTEERFLF